MPTNYVPPGSLLASRPALQPRQDARNAKARTERALPTENRASVQASDIVGYRCNFFIRQPGGNVCHDLRLGTTALTVTELIQ